ncbi:hypothetical protein Gogos_012750, partial [Gossypium gossypioides]|nr:hypothetical protein [Gossypium gossypioides]
MCQSIELTLVLEILFCNNELKRERILKKKKK